MLKTNTESTGHNKQKDQQSCYITRYGVETDEPRNNRGNESMIIGDLHECPKRVTSQPSQDCYREEQNKIKNQHLLDSFII